MPPCCPTAAAGQLRAYHLCECGAGCCALLLRTRLLPNRLFLKRLIKHSHWRVLHADKKWLAGKDIV